MPQPRRIVGRALTTALKVWLRSQLDHVTDLVLVIDSGDRQLLMGRIPQVHLTAEKAVYQGVYLSHISVIAHHIEINLKQVLSGKPLQLLQPVPIDLSLSLPAADLQKSLSAPILKTSVSHFLQTFLETQLRLTNAVLDVTQVHIEGEQLILTADVVSDAWLATGTLRTSLTIGEPQQLCLGQLEWQWQNQETAPRYSLGDHTFDLGSEVNLKSLVLTSTSIACTGEVTIQP